VMGKQGAQTPRPVDAPSRPVPRIRMRSSGWLI
jgi:hypothetical protein